jgi:phospholipid/cholesterol/gamma-HCH transport system permease protein
LPLVRAISTAGELILRPVSAFGKYGMFLSNSVQRIVFPPVRARLLLRQLEFVGNRSFGIVFISATMIGAVFGLILGDIFRTLGTESMLAAAAGIALSKELAPVFAGFLVTARAGSSMAAEIATMRVNEQIDAMRVMAVNPYGYLVAPRVLAGVVMLPLLASIFILVGVVTAFIVGIVFFDIDVGSCIEKMRWMVKPRYIIQGLEKAAVFGAILTSIGCYKGFFAGGGAKGVGRATTEAVVISLVAILVADYFLSYLQFDKVF